MRTLTDVLILATAWTGSFDSAAAMLAISEPQSEKKTVATPATTTATCASAKSSSDG